MKPLLTHSVFIQYVKAGLVQVHYWKTKTITQHKQHKYDTKNTNAMTAWQHSNITHTQWTKHKRNRNTNNTGIQKKNKKQENITKKIMIKNT